MSLYIHDHTHEKIKLIKFYATFLQFCIVVVSKWQKSSKLY